MLVALILNVVFIADTCTQSPDGQTTGKSAVILVPGDGGSRSFCKMNGSSSVFLIWVNVEYFLYPEAFSRYFRAVYNPETGELSDGGVCTVLFPGWGSTESIENLDTYAHSYTKYFEPLVTSLLQDSFYVRNKTLRGTPFDFRRSPNENGKFFPDLKTLIEETFVISGNRPIVLIGHSLGSLYSSVFLKNQSDSWKEKYIKTFISVSGPHGGSVKALKLEASGDNFGVVVRSPLSFRDVQRSLASTAYLLPDPRLWPSTEPIVITPTVNYSAHDYERFFKDVDYELGYVMMLKTKGTHDHFVGPTGIKELYCIHGSNVATTYQMVYYPPTFYRSAFPNQVPQLITGDGDGTVHTRSLEVCQQWPGAQHVVLPGAEHLRIVGDKRFIDIVHQVSGAEF